MAERNWPTPAVPPGDVPTLPGVGDGAEHASDVVPADDPVEGAAGEDEAGNLVGRTIGRYEIQKVLGRGGMGIVYLARDPSLDRLVALKVLVDGELASPEAVARFQREAQAIARIQHPNIAQVYESGSAGGRPFLVMEYLAGGTLADHGDGRPLRPLDAAEIVETLARAMQAAHDKDVIHRDLKPGNVLATEDGTLKICDFGLAKRLDIAEGHTATGAILGSPSYMAPEQAGGVVKNVGPACDVYSLGAVLYELLTGRPPFYAPDAMQTVLMVLADEPVSIRRLQPQVPRDLSTICQKCLEKSPKRRYASALDLADDLDRFQNGLPIAARPVRSWERAARWARRRPAAAGLIAVSVLAAATLLIGGAWYNAQLRRTNDRLADQLRRSNQLVAEGDELAQWVLGDHINEIGRLRGGTAAQKELIDRFRTYLAGLSANANDQDPLLRTIARSWLRLAQIQGGTDNSNVGDPVGALASGEEAERLYRRALRVDPDDADLKLGLLNCRRMLIHLRTALGRPQQEEAELRGLIKELEAIGAEGKIEPDRMRAIECEARNDLSWLLRIAGRTEEAAEELRRALSVAEQLSREPPDGAMHESTTDLIRQNLALTLEQVGDLKGALEHTERLIKSSARQVAASPTDAQLLRSQAVLLETHGDILSGLKRNDESLSAFRQSGEILRSLAADDPENAQLQNDLAAISDRLATMLYLKQDYAAAKGVLDDAVAAQERLLAKAPTHLEYRRRAASLAVSLGQNLGGLKQWDAAIAAQERGLAIRRELAAEDPSRSLDRVHLAESALHLGLTYYSRGSERMVAGAAQGKLELFQTGIADVRQAREMYRMSGAEFAALERSRPLEPKERSQLESVRKLLAMTDESLAPFDMPIPASTPKPSAAPSAPAVPTPTRPSAPAPPPTAQPASTKP